MDSMPSSPTQRDAAARQRGSGAGKPDGQARIGALRREGPSASAEARKCGRAQLRLCGSVQRSRPLPRGNFVKSGFGQASWRTRVGALAQQRAAPESFGWTGQLDTVWAPSRSESNAAAVSAGAAEFKPSESPVNRGRKQLSFGLAGSASVERGASSEVKGTSYRPRPVGCPQILG